MTSVGCCCCVILSSTISLLDGEMCDNAFFLDPCFEKISDTPVLPLGESDSASVRSTWDAARSSTPGSSVATTNDWRDDLERQCILTSCFFRFLV